MFASIEVLMIGRQIWWMSSYVSWHPIYLQGLRVIVWNGSWQKMGILLYVHFTISYMVLLLLFFLGKTFGRLRHPNLSLSLRGQQHGIGSSREITCGLGVLTLSTGALCVVAVVRQWIICCYIVERLIGYGALSLGFLGFLGFPHVRCKIFYLVGGIGWGRIPLTSGT